MKKSFVKLSLGQLLHLRPRRHAQRSQESGHFFISKELGSGKATFPLRHIKKNSFWPFIPWHYLHRHGYFINFLMVLVSHSTGKHFGKSQ